MFCWELGLCEAYRWRQEYEHAMEEMKQARHPRVVVLECLGAGAAPCAICCSMRIICPHRAHTGTGMVNVRPPASWMLILISPCLVPREELLPGHARHVGIPRTSTAFPERRRFLPEAHDFHAAHAPHHYSHRHGHGHHRRHWV